MRNLNVESAFTMFGNKIQSLFESSWIAFLRVLAATNGLKVVWGGNPRTDGNTIWLPRLPINLTLDNLWLLKAHGYHEVAHCLFSDMLYWVAFSVKSSPLERGLAKTIEDPFIEKYMIRKSQASERYLRARPVLLMKQGRAATGDKDMQSALEAYVLNYLQRQKGWEEYQPSLDATRENFCTHFGQGALELLAKVKALLDAEFPRINHTRGSCALAKKIVELLKQEQDDAETEEQKKEEKDSSSDLDDTKSDSNSSESSGKEEDDDDSGTSSDGEKANGDGDPDSKGEGGNPSNDLDSKEKGDESSGGQGGGDAKAESTGGSTSGDEKNEGNSKAENLNQLVNSNVDSSTDVDDTAKALKALSKEAEERGEEMMPDIELDYTLPSGGGSRDADGGLGAGSYAYDNGLVMLPSDPKGFRAILDSVSADTGRMVQRLRRLLSNRVRKLGRVTDNGNISGKLLYRLPQDNVKVFRRKQTVVKPTAAVSLLCDLSGSTQHDLIAESIQQSAVMLSVAMDRIGNPMEVLGFAPCGSKSNKLLVCIKSFSESLALGKNRFGSMPAWTGGDSTLLTEALLEAGMRISQCKEKRKLLFAITDGRPNSESTATDMIQQLEAAGIIVVVLVVGQRPPTKWLEDAGCCYVSVTDITALTESLLSTLTDKLM
ncbi:MAG: hypothetical protein V3T17_02950 [Pseudomonadales bacterium]